MPGLDDYDVVIGVSVADNTSSGLSSVEKNLKKSADDIKKHGDKQAREFAKNSREMFSKTEQDATRSAGGIVKKLVGIFDTHNFLLRNMARQAGSTYGSIAIGIGKMALSYQRMGKDTEDAAHKGRIALQDLRTAVDRIGSDSDAFKKAVQATRNLATAYEGMGKSAHASSIKAGSALEELVHRRIINVQNSLLKAQTAFETLRKKGSYESQVLSSKITDISASLKHLLGGANADAAFFRSFIKAEDHAKRYLLVLDKLGPRAALAFETNHNAVEKLATAFVRLEARSGRFITSEGEKLARGAAKVAGYKKELESLEKGITAVGTASEETTPAVTGFLGALGGIGLIGAGVVVVIIAIIAAVAALAIGMVKGASAAMEYGDELYKLSVATGLSVKNLSVLSIIANETGTQIDSLAKTFVRTQIQVQRGLDKPFSEAGRAIRTLGVNMKELRTQNPDKQVFTLAKAFAELNNQNVRATVSAQLFSRDAEKQSKMLFEIANGYDAAQKKAHKYGLELDESGAVKAHLATVATQDLKMAWEGLWVSAGEKILPQLTLLLESFTEWILKAGGAFAVFGKIANAVLHELRAQVEFMRESTPAEMVMYGVSPAILLTAEIAKRKKINQVLAAEDKQQEAEYKKRIAELLKLQQQGDDKYAAGKGKDTKSDLDRLLEQVKKLRFEIQALQDVTHPAHALRYELEDLQKVKSIYESIFKLRKDMGLSLNEPVPKYRVFGTQEEQEKDLANLTSYIKQMERMKAVFDDVIKVTNEQADALAELAKVTQEAMLPVVDAGTLAEIKYQTAFRNRIKAEKELTADVISESRLRKDAIEDELGATLKAYMSLKRDLGRAQDTTREQRIQDTLFNQVVSGQITEQQLQEKLAARIGPTGAPTVPSELTTIAAHAATIDLNVAAIAERLGATTVNTTKTQITSEPSQGGYAYERYVIRKEDGSVVVVSERDLNEPAGGDVIKTDTEGFDSTRAQIIKAARDKAVAGREAATRAANQSIIDDTQAMAVELIDIDLDYLKHYQSQQNARRTAARETAVNLKLLDKDLTDLLIADSDLYKDTWASADEARKQSLRSLRTENINLQNEIYNNGYDLNDRLENARLKSIRSIQEASTAAQESIIANQVKIADATVYHAEIADAAVMEFLANQKSVTQIIADAKVQVIQTTFNAIDQGLSKLTEKLGFAKDLVKDIISGFIRAALTPFFRSIFTGQSGQSGGGGGIVFGGGGFPGTGGGGAGTGPVNISGGSVNGMLQNLMGGAGVGGLTAPASVSSMAGGATWAQFGKNMGGISPANFVGRHPGQFAQGIAGALPLLGMSLGVQAGGQSVLGSVLGGAGGLLAGGMGMAAILGTTTGVFATGGSLAFLAPLLTNPFTAVAAAALIAGALILKVNKERRKNEEIRNDLSIQTVTGLEAIYQEALAGNLNPAEAEKKFNDLKTQYFENISGFDSKTKRIATDWWYGAEHPPQVYWNKIRAAAEKGEVAQNIRDRMVPVFSTGGYSTESQLIKVRPGEGVRYPGSNVVHTVFGKDRGYDTEYMYAPQGTRILNQGEMKQAQPFQSGGTVGSGMPDLVIDKLELNIDADGLASIVISSPHFNKAVIRGVRVGKKEKKIA